MKNQNLGLEVPYRYGSEMRTYIPDFVILVDDGHGPDDPLHLIVEIKGYRREDAKDKKLTMDTYWIPGVNNLRAYGRWAFAEFAEVYQMESDFQTKIDFCFLRLEIPRPQRLYGFDPRPRHSSSQCRNGLERSRPWHQWFINPMCLLEVLVLLTVSLQCTQSVPKLRDIPWGRGTRASAGHDRSAIGQRIVEKSDVSYATMLATL